MSDWLDFNDDGDVDAGEEYIGYQIFRDVTSGSSYSSGSRRGRVDGWTVFLILLVGYAVVNTICGWLY